MVQSQVYPVCHNLINLLKTQIKNKCEPQNFGASLLILPPAMETRLSLAKGSQVLNC